MSDIDSVPVGQKIIRLHPADQPGNTDQTPDKGKQTQQTQHFQQPYIVHIFTTCRGPMRCFFFAAYGMLSSTVPKARTTNTSLLFPVHRCSSIDIPVKSTLFQHLSPDQLL